MTDDQWHQAMRKYSSSRPGYRSTGLVGGANELARELESAAERQPERFIEVILQAPQETHPAYVAATLRALGRQHAALRLDLLMAVCEKAFADYRGDVGTELADILGAIDRPLPQGGVRMLVRLATEHPDPSHATQPNGADQASEERPRFRDLETAGLNSVRGRGVLALARRVERDSSEAALFQDAIERTVRDSSAAVRSLAALLPRLVAKFDETWAFRLFGALLNQRLSEDDDRLLATRHVRSFVAWDVRTNLARQRSNVARALDSPNSDVSAAGAAWAAVAGLFHEDATDLVEKAYACSDKARQQIAELASHALRHLEHRQWCEQHLRRLFSDDSREVRGAAARCWRELKGRSLEDYRALLEGFCDSRAFPEEAECVLNALDESVHRLPELTCRVLEKLVERADVKTWDWRLSSHVDERIVTRLLLRTYHQHRTGPLAARCLDLLDRMSLSGGRSC